MPTVNQVKRATRIYNEWKIEGDKIVNTFSPKRVNIAEMLAECAIKIISEGLENETKVAKKKIPDV